ncbi:MAG: hypothetical protein M1448_00635 [Candidatus Marsarchaeota archaeon]|jgi:hypothetical protein|nr:hypothetical protein [Candidatus Marsarchaeota archaeon]
MVNDTFYDVDSVGDLLDLLAKDPSIADDLVRKDISAFTNKDDLVLTKKVLSGTLKIVSVKKMDATLIGTYFK